MCGPPVLGGCQAPGPRLSLQKYSTFGVLGTTSGVSPSAPEQDLSLKQYSILQHESLLVPGDLEHGRDRRKVVGGENSSRDGDPLFVTFIADNEPRMGLEMWPMAEPTVIPLGIHI